MGFYDFSKKHYLISAALGDKTSKFTKISRDYPKKTFLRNYFKHMRRAIHQFADLLYSSDDKNAGRLISLDEERSKTFVDLTALYFTIAMTSRKENVKLLKSMNLSKPSLLGELYNQLEFDSDERKLGKHFASQSALDFSTFTSNWCKLFYEKILRPENPEISQEEEDKLLQMVHSSFLFYMKAFS